MLVADPILLRGVLIDPQDVLRARRADGVRKIVVSWSYGLHGQWTNDRPGR